MPLAQGLEGVAQGPNVQVPLYIHPEALIVPRIERVQLVVEDEELLRVAARRALMPLPLREGLPARSPCIVIIQLNEVKMQAQPSIAALQAEPGQDRTGQDRHEMRGTPYASVLVQTRATPGRCCAVPCRQRMRQDTHLTHALSPSQLLRQGLRPEAGRLT